MCVVLPDPSISIHAETKSTIITNEHTSLGKYTSHFIRKGCERVMCERWVGDWTKTATHWPPVPPFLAARLSHSAGCSTRGPEGPQPYAGRWFSLPRTATTDSKLTEPVCGPGIYNCLTSTYFLWAWHLHPIQPIHSQGYTLISSSGCNCSLIDGSVGGPYVTCVLH